MMITIKGFKDFIPQHWRLQCKASDIDFKLSPHGKWLKHLWRILPRAFYPQTKDGTLEWFIENSCRASGRHNTQEVALYMISRSINATAGEIKQVLGIKEASIRAIMSRLRHKGHKIESKKVKDRGTVYILKGEAEL